MEPTEAELKKVVSIMLKLVDVQPVLEEPSDEWFKRVLVNEVEPSSSPGLPWKKIGCPKGSSFVQMGEIQDKATDLYQAFATRLVALMDGPEADPISCFIKPEPHKPAKVKNGAWRIIAGVGITDCFVDRFLFGDFLKKSIDKARSLNNPLLPGFVPYGGNFRKLAACFENPQTADKSSWDWTVQPWMVKVLRMYFRSLLPVQYHAILENRLTSLFEKAEFDFDGYRFRQQVPGIMKSGCLGTIIFNSLLQLAIHVLSCQRSGSPLKMFFAVGDDTIQEAMPDKYWQEVQKVGAIVKERIEGWPAEFIGVYFNTQLGLPMYATKNFFRLLFAEPDLLDDILQGYMRLYANSPLFEALAALASKRGLTLSYQQCREWFNGP